MSRIAASYGIIAGNRGAAEVRAAVIGGYGCQSAKISGDTGGRVMAAELQYRGFRIMLVVHGIGWRVFIHEPGSNLVRQEVFYTADPAGRASVVEDAKRIIDELLL